MYGYNVNVRIGRTTRAALARTAEGGCPYGFTFRLAEEMDFWIPRNHRTRDD